MERPWRMQGAAGEGQDLGCGQHLRGGPGAQAQAGSGTPEGSAEQVCREPGCRGHRDDQGKFHLSS